MPAPTPIREDAQTGQFDHMLEDDALEFMVAKWLILDAKIAAATEEVLGENAPGIEDGSKFPRSSAALMAAIRKQLDEAHAYQGFDDGERMRIGPYVWTVHTTEREAEEEARQSWRRNGIGKGTLAKSEAE